MSPSPKQADVPVVVIRWWSFGRVRRLRFAAMIRADIERKIYTDEFFSDLRDRLRDQERIYWRLNILSLSIVALLFIRLYWTPTEAEWFGIKITDFGRLKEVLLVVVATVLIFVTAVKLDIDDLYRMLTVRAEQTSSPDHWPFTKRRYSTMFGGIPAFVPPSKKWMMGSWVFVIWARTLVILGVSFIGIVVVLLLSIQVEVLIDIWRHPSLPWHWSQIVIGYDLLSVLFYLALIVGNYVPFPWRDYGLLMRLNELQKKDPAAHRRHLNRAVKILVKRKRFMRSLGLPRVKK